MFGMGKPIIKVGFITMRELMDLDVLLTKFLT